MLFLQALVLEDLAKNGTLEKTLSHKKVGYYTGSFGPLHKGHEHFVQLVIKQKLCDYIIIYPSWGGDSYKSRIDVQLRLNMLFSVFAKNPRVIVTKYKPKELQRVLTKAKADSKFRTPKFPGLEFIDIIGSDAALWLAKNEFFLSVYGQEMQDEWANRTMGCHVALPICAFIVAQRPGDDLKPLHKKIKGRGIIVIKASTIKEYSSAVIKERLKSGKDISELVSPSVKGIIHKCKLYQK